LRFSISGGSLGNADRALTQALNPILPSLLRHFPCSHVPVATTPQNLMERAVAAIGAIVLPEMVRHGALAISSGE
jgi:hypothetical protein